MLWKVTLQSGEILEGFGSLCHEFQNKLQKSPLSSTVWLQVGGLGALHQDKVGGKTLKSNNL